MSTNEPPVGAAPNGSPEYGQPQDPWAGGFDYTPGQSFVPTDPIPHQFDPYQGYPPGYAAPDPWGRGPTQGQPWMAPPKKGRAVPVLVLVVVLLVVGGGGGAALWYFLTHQEGTGTTTDPTPSVSVSTTSTGGAPATTEASPVPSPFDPYAVVEGDCLINYGSTADPLMQVVACKPVPNREVFHVLKIVKGDQIGQDDNGKISQDEARAACAGTRFERYYQNDFSDDSRDIVFCMNFQR